MWWKRAVCTSDKRTTAITTCPNRLRKCAGDLEHDFFWAFFRGHWRVAQTDRQIEIHTNRHLFFLPSGYKTCGENSRGDRAPFTSLTDVPDTLSVPPSGTYHADNSRH